MENLQETIDVPIFLWGFPVIFPLNQPMYKLVIYERVCCQLHLLTQRLGLKS